jgi:di/tricarboxylate transporter
MAKEKEAERVRFDGDAKLQAFLGAVAFLLAALFWAFMALRLGLAASAFWPVAAAACALSALAFFLAWRLRAKMEAEVAFGRWDVRRLFLAGLVLGLGLGALPYLILRFKLEDPDFIHLASKPENLPPAFR